MIENKKYKTVIIGAGPAGLAAGYELAQAGQTPLVLEKENRAGGLCRTLDCQGYKFDFGGHRFFTKNPEVQKFWQAMLGDDFLTRPRLSRIYYKRKFFAYPIKLFDALSKLGIGESFLVGLSLIWVKIKKIFKKPKEVTFEDWIVNRFGQRLFEHFFKSYTEKMWGISVKELGADWAAQRMKDLSLWQLLKGIIFGSKEGEVKSIIEKFEYPKYGPGMLYDDKIKNKIIQLGGQVELNTTLISIKHTGQEIEKIIVKNKDNNLQEIIADNYISSVPLTIMLQKLDPGPPDEIMALVNKMRFRAFFDVCLIVNKKDVFPDNWIYVHEPQVKLLRVQNFKNWSPYMSPDENKTPIGAEYVCWPDDDLWHMSDEQLIALATKELEQIGLIKAGLVEDGVVIRNKYAYPVYHLDYKQDLEQIFNYLSRFKNFQTIGRSGLYRYNNMDHSILTGFYAARNLMGGDYNVLDVNADEEYHEVSKE